MIVLTLYLHQDKPLPQWPCDITLNSLLSVLSQLGQWGLMGSVAKAIGQLKWLWFTQIKRPLTDFVAFDEASIGPWGSFLLLVKGWLMHWVSLGALIVIVTQAFQPIVQQAVTYPIRLQHSGISTVTRSVDFRDVDGLNSNVNKTYLINPMKASIYNGLYNSNVALSDLSASFISGKTETKELTSWSNLNSTLDYVVKVPDDDTQNIMQGRYTVINGNPIYESDAIEVLVDTLLVEPYDLAAMVKFLNGLATSMTNTLRSGNWSEIVNGTSYSQVNYVKVRWPWLIVPAAVLLLSLLFLVATMRQSSQMNVKPWKTSTLATLQGLSGALHNELGSLDTESRMEEEAERRLVQLKKENNGWRLVEHK
ncbi:hypothetical protein MMC12_005982 [Toensbergia leucococca]|nr:hypothetical protein [Toensbergia leucococca]